MEPELWTCLISVLGIWVIMVLSPGPNFLATAYTAATQCSRMGIGVAGGIGFGTTIWACASLLGLGLIFQTAAWLYGLVKLAGGLYLIYLGVRTVMRAGKGGHSKLELAKNVSLGQAFMRGLGVDLSNPKAAVFFGSLFAATVPPDSPLWFKVLLVASLVLIASGWYALVALVCNLGPVNSFLQRSRTVLDYITGGLFVGLGLKLAAGR
jgi:threonine efflux protein